MSDVEETVETLRKMRAEGAGFLVMIEALRRDESFRLTPVRLMWVFQEAVGLPWPQFRDGLLEYLDTTCGLSCRRRSSRGRPRNCSPVT